MTEDEALDLAAKAAGWGSWEYVKTHCDPGERPAIRAHAKTLMENARLEQRVRELEEALRPFVQSCAWVEPDDYPIRISNDHTASGFDLTQAEVEAARKALGGQHDRSS